MVLDCGGLEFQREDKLERGGRSIVRLRRMEGEEAEDGQAAHVCRELRDHDVAGEGQNRDKVIGQAGAQDVGGSSWARKIGHGVVPTSIMQGEET